MQSVVLVQWLVSGRPRRAASTCEATSCPRGLYRCQTVAAQGHRGCPAVQRPRAIGNVSSQRVGCGRPRACHTQASNPRALWAHRGRSTLTASASGNGSSVPVYHRHGNRGDILFRPNLVGSRWLLVVRSPDDYMLVEQRDHGNEHG